MPDVDETSGLIVIREQQGVSGSAFIGLIDPLNGTNLSGWVVRQDGRPDAVHLRVNLDGRTIGTIECKRKNSDKQGTEGARFFYEIPDPYLDGTTHVLSVELEDGSDLCFGNENGAPQPTVTFTAEPVTSIEGIVDGLQGDRIKGWVIRKHHRTGLIEGRLQVQMLCNDIVLAESIANLSRIDVSREHGCEPTVGFDFQVPAHYSNGTEHSFVFRVLPTAEELAGSPLAVKHRRSEGINPLRIITKTVNDLCAQAFALQQQIRNMLPAAEATVTNYDPWARRNLNLLRARLASAPPLAIDPPLVSIVMPTYKTNLAHLTAAIESVVSQTYVRWELVVVDDGSRQPALTACLRNYEDADLRIVCLINHDNKGISAATNDALSLATGDYVVLFDHDDLLVDVAIEAMVREAVRTKARFVYSDEDKIDGFGVLSEPNLKPDWNYRLLLGINYICHLVMIERTLLERVGPLRAEYDGAQDHDLLLRISEACGPGEIVHLAEILYHWRKSASSTAEAGEAKPYAIDAGRRAVRDHLGRTGFADSRVTPVGSTTCYSVTWGMLEEPSVTIIVPFKDQIETTRHCLDCLRASTTWSNWRVVLVDNGSVTPEAERFCADAVRDPRVFVRRIDEPFNYSRLNNIAAREHPAEYYVFLNNDVFLTQSDWLRVLVDEALADPEVGIVGAKLLYPNGTVQHAGVVLGVGGIADHVFKGLPADHPGYLGRALCAQEYSAVTAACLLCRADVFMDVGGFDEQELIIAFNDVDLCLKVRKQGRKVIWTPALVAEHHESLSRGDDVSPTKAPRFFYENHVMLSRWHDVLPRDPFYSPHFSRDRGLFTDLG